MAMKHECINNQELLGLLSGIQLGIFEVIWPASRWITRIWVRYDTGFRFFVEAVGGIDQEQRADFERLLNELMEVARDHSPEGLGPHRVEYGIKAPADHNEFFSDSIFRQIAEKHAPWRLNRGR